MALKDAPVQFRALLKRFAWTYLLAAALVTALAWPLVVTLDKGRDEVRFAREHGHIQIAIRVLGKDFFEAIGDLHLLANQPVVGDWLDHGSPDARDALAHHFELVAAAYRRYGKIRLIDERGREAIRVDFDDGRAVRIPAQRLQDRSERAYFQEASRMARGEVHVSPMDLNVEEGVVETPYRPTVRFVTPVFDRGGRRRGVLVLNYLADRLLADFRKTMEEESGRTAMLLDSEGYWLSSPQTEDEWGFALGRRDLTYAARAPAQWREISAQDRGEIDTGKGRILFDTVRPLRGAGRSGSPSPGPWIEPQQAEAYRWKIVLWVPSGGAEDETPFILRRAVPWLLLYGALAAAIFLSAYLVVRRKALRRQERDTAREIRDLYEHAPCGYHSLDATGLILRMNRTQLDWLGYSRDEVVGRLRYGELLAADGRAAFEGDLARIARGDELRDVELQLLRKDGSLLPVSMSSTALCDEAGDFLMSRTTVFDVTERKRLELELTRQAQIDPLTGAANRRRFYEVGTREMSRCRRLGRPFSLLLIDIDHFKRINDTRGHDAGDAVLVALTRRCTQMLRDIDLLARVGGEEFAILLPETDLGQARVPAERLRIAISELRVPAGDGDPLSLTVSIGLAAFRPEDADLDATLKRADLGLYAAKAAGRNRLAA